MIKKLFALLLTLIMLFGTVLPAYAYENEYYTIDCEEEYAMQVDQLQQERADAWNDYCQAMLSDPMVQSETEEYAMSFGDVVMRYYVTVIGDQPESGYPLYIALHGGGSGDTPDVNDEQWEEMTSYYSYELDCGVYIAVRGVRDTWDTHFNPESYSLYDRLIEYAFLSSAVDPNRVYLEGFSAGGDGVYAIAPRMADRFAAVNMSSGHPNDVPLYNLLNLPIQLQAGEYDEDYDRNTVTAKYGMMLDDLQQEYGGYEHRTLIHYDCGHNYEDNSKDPIPVMSDPAQWVMNGDRSTVDVDSFPPDYMDQFVRDPIPDRVIWDLSTRAPLSETESFYYLSAPYETDTGFLTVSIDRTQNTVWIDAQELNGPFSLLLNEEMVDFSQPIQIEANGDVTNLYVTPDRRVLIDTTYDRGDPNYQFEAEILFDASGNILF